MQYKNRDFGAGGIQWVSYFLSCRECPKSCVTVTAFFFMYKLRKLIWLLGYVSKIAGEIANSVEPDQTAP